MHLLTLALVVHFVRVTAWPSTFGTLGGIARYEHVSLTALERANPQVHNPNLIYVGEKIYLPGSAPTPTVHVTTVPPVRQGRSPNHYPYGWCTWGAANLAHDNVDHLGNAWMWIYNARARGLPTGTVPRVGATAVFQPGVQGASSLGHVAHVVAVGKNGYFEVEGMAAPYWGRYSFSWVHTGRGVSFIY